MFKVVSRIIRIPWNNVWRIEIWSRWRIKFDGSEVGEIKEDEVEVDEAEVGDLFAFSCEHHLICFSVSERNSFQWPFSDWNKNVSNGFSKEDVQHCFGKVPLTLVQKYDWIANWVFLNLFWFRADKKCVQDSFTTQKCLEEPLASNSFWKWCFISYLYLK